MKPKFPIGHRVHWFEYYSDMVVKDGGHGMIISVDLMPGHHVLFYYTILKDGGMLSKFPEKDLEEINWFEEKNESEKK